ncbi:MAG: contractile injection system protein, VgrG/Pvc8 family [Candidatus Sedimenticola sp. (ex Thyasira tokunagai)]
MTTSHNRPDYRITIDGSDRTNIFNGRFISLNLRDLRGFEADTLTITISDHDGIISLPRRGAVIEPAIGWHGEALIEKGKFIVDEVSHNGPPDTITITARSADFRKGMKTQRTHGWHDTTLGDLLRTIATRHQLEAVVSPALDSVAIAHLDQTNESDANLLTRLGLQHDAIAAIKSGRLLFTAAGMGKSSSGKGLPPLIIHRHDGDRHRYREADRQSEYTGVQTTHWDDQTAQLLTFTAGEPGNLKTLRTSHATADEAKAAGAAEWARIKRGTATMSVTLAIGQAALIPESPITLVGWKREITEKAWLCTEITHQVGDGYSCDLVLELKQ